MQQYGRVGRNGMSPIREMCTASKLFFSLFWKFLRICAEQLQRSGEKKKKLSIFKRPVTVKSTWIGKGESSAVNNIYILYQVLVKIQGANFVLEQEALSLLLPPAEVRYNSPGRNAVSGQRRSVSLL